MNQLPPAREMLAQPQTAVRVAESVASRTTLSTLRGPASIWNRAWASAYGFYASAWATWAMMVHLFRFAYCVPIWYVKRLYHSVRTESIQQEISCGVCRGCKCLFWKHMVASTAITSVFASRMYAGSGLPQVSMLPRISALRPLEPLLPDAPFFRALIGSVCLTTDHVEFYVVRPTVQTAMQIATAFVFPPGFAITAMMDTARYVSTRASMQTGATDFFGPLAVTGVHMLDNALARSRHNAGAHFLQALEQDFQAFGRGAIEVLVGASKIEPGPEPAKFES